MISVLIFTKNEEGNLPGCLESARWSDDIHVCDSGSADGTVAIAQRAGAHVLEKASRNEETIFGGNEAEHKNWALSNIPFQYEWVLHLDADERVTPELAASIQRAVRNPGDKVAFRMQRRDFWGDRWLKHSQACSYYPRLFRPEKMRYERLINPVSLPDGPVGELAGFLDHHPFRKGVAHWLSRHNSYSSLEARQIAINRAANRRFRLGEAFFGKTSDERRFHQKGLFYGMPGRPLLRFLFFYVAKRGFLDGRAGFRYAVLQSFYEYMIVLKARELPRDGLAAADPATAAGEARAAAQKNLAANRNASDSSPAGFHRM
jgi:glycosyltransferase involved in cell wall biosynthesis